MHNNRRSIRIRTAYTYLARYMRLATLYDGISRGLYRHTRATPHQSVMGVHPYQTIMGGIWPNKAS